MATFASENAKRAIQPYWWIDIEGLRYRYGTLKDNTDSVFDAWNPADTGTNRHIKEYLAEEPQIGGQQADPFNGDSDIPSHSFTLFDKDDEITALLSTSDTPFVRSVLTQSISSSQTTLTAEDTSDFAAGGGIIYVNRETVIYSATSTAKSKAAQTASLDHVGLTATGGTVDYLMDDVINYITEDYYVGAILTVTAGTNNGEVRTVTAYYKLGAAVYYEWDTPMPAACDATTVFSITTPPNKLRSAGLNEAEDYWNGAVVEFTGGTNVGLTAWVDDFVAATDTCSLIGYLPKACDATTTFNIAVSEFTGCTRGAFGSTASTHGLVDENNAVSRVLVSTKIPFIKSRQVTIYENRTNCAENQAIATRGFIDNYSLTKNNTCYTFQCSGLSKLLDNKVLTKQKKGQLVEPLWGGSFFTDVQKTYIDDTVDGTIVRKEGHTWTWRFCSSEGRMTGFTINHLLISKNNDFPTSPTGGANIKIDDEIIHYENIEYIHPTINIDGVEEVIYGIRKPVMRLSTTQTLHIMHTLYNQSDAAACACYHNRGLFSDKIGAPNIKNDLFLSKRAEEFSNQAGGNTDNDTNMVSASSWEYESLDIKAFIQEHDIDAEVLQVLMCDGTSKGDFPRYDQIIYSGRAGGSWTTGDVITGGTSGTVGYVMGDTPSGTDGFLEIAVFEDGVFTNGENVSEPGGVNATADTCSDVNGMRPRNNIIDIALQMMCSTGTVGSNGKYDTLAEGFGADIDQTYIDLIDIEAMRDKYFGNITVNFVIHEPTSLKEWLVDNVFLPCQIFPYETYDGTISLGYLMTYQEAVDADDGSLTTFDDDHMDAFGVPSWSSGDPPISKIQMKCNFRPTTSDHFSTLNFIFGNSNEWYKDLGRTKEIESRAVYFVDPTLRTIRHKDEKLTPLLRRMTSVLWDRLGQYSAPIIIRQTPYSDIKNNISDIVIVTEANLPNFRTSLRSLSAEYFQILGYQRLPNRTAIEWTLMQIGVHDNKYSKRAPSAVVVSYVSNVPVPGKSRITCQPSAYSGPDMHDVASFTAGEKVKFMASDYDTTATPDATIDAVNGPNDTITFTANLAPAPVAGYIVEYDSYDDCISGQQSGRAWFADENHLLGTGNDSAFKYM